MRNKAQSLPTRLSLSASTAQNERNGAFQTSVLASPTRGDPEEANLRALAEKEAEAAERHRSAGEFFQIWFEYELPTKFGK